MISTSKFGGLCPASWAASDAMVLAIAGSSMRCTRATLLVHVRGEPSKLGLSKHVALCNPLDSERSTGPVVGAVGFL
jgi:hypothetical protein